MLKNTQLIVLHSTKYSETSMIAQVYSQDFGRISLMLKGIRSRKSKNKVALIQPLSILDAEIYHKAKNQLHTVKSISGAVPYADIPYDFAKRSIAIFIAEVLYRVVKEEEENNALFNYIKNSLLFFDEIKSGVANFHIVFLFFLTRYLGFFPDNNYDNLHSFFDLMAGNFVSRQPSHKHFIHPEYSHFFIDLFSSSLSIEGLNLKLTNSSRSILLEKLVEYYYLHNDGMGTIKSLEILRQVLAD